MVLKSSLAARVMVTVRAMVRAPQMVVRALVVGWDEAVVVFFCAVAVEVAADTAAAKAECSMPACYTGLRPHTHHVHP